MKYVASKDGLPNSGLKSPGEDLANASAGVGFGYELRLHAQLSNALRAASNSNNQAIANTARLFATGNPSTIKILPSAQFQKQVTQPYVQRTPRGSGVINLSYNDLIKGDQQEFHLLLNEEDLTDPTGREAVFQEALLAIAEKKLTSRGPI